MFSKELHTHALDIFIEAVISHQKQKAIFPYIESIAVFLNKFFNTEEFTTFINKKSDFYTNQLLTEDDRLFIHQVHVPQLIKDGILITEFDKFCVFLIIKGWINQFQVPHELIFDKLQYTLNIESRTFQLIKLLFNPEAESKKDEHFFILTPEKELTVDKLEGEWVQSNQPEVKKSFQHISVEKINHTIYTIFIKEHDCFVMRCNQPVQGISKNGIECPDFYCVLQAGEFIKIGNDTDLFFADLKKRFVDHVFSINFYLTALEVEHRYRKKALTTFSFIGQPGELVGIIGVEGSGKSTFLKLLAGDILPTKGTIMVNGYDIFKNRFQLSGFIGFVPEEDLLFYDLTARENLEIAANLYLRGKSSVEIAHLVEEVLHTTELTDIADVIIGKPRSKFIQPGQRRLLNIALELLRDPKILIIDNAISNLSLGDSNRIIKILSKYSFKGKLIITSITQTSAKTFELFDKLFILNESGNPVYFGPRQLALEALLKDVPEGFKNKYSNKYGFTSEQLLELMEEGQNYSNGIVSKEKLINPKKYEAYAKGVLSESIKIVRKRKKIPGNQNHAPKLEKQFLVYTLRNFKTRLAKRSELLFTSISAPVIGLLLALILRNSDSETYRFALNPNIPAFFILCLLLNFFNGMAQTSTEIIREKHVLRKEEFINISRFSYINAKITLFLVLLLFQTLFFTFIVNQILEIKGFLVTDWMVYFSCGAAGGLLGLIFSSTQKSVDTILLRSIPITILVMFILGGEWISLRNMNTTKEKYTPLVADFVVTRWGYEALMVKHFTENEYNRYFYSADKKISNGTFNSFQVIPRLKAYAEYISENPENENDSVELTLKTIRNQIDYYKLTENIYPFEYAEQLTIDQLNDLISNELKDYISYLDYYFYNKYTEGYKQKKQITDSLIITRGNDALEKLLAANHNQAIAQRVRNSSTRENYKIIDNQIIQLSDPVFQRPSNNSGRARLYTPEKRFNSQIIDTYIFNISMIWMFCFIFYVLLITDMINKLPLRLPKF